MLNNNEIVKFTNKSLQNIDKHENVAYVADSLKSMTNNDLINSLLYVHDVSSKHLLEISKYAIDKFEQAVVAAIFSDISHYRDVADAIKDANETIRQYVIQNPNFDIQRLKALSEELNRYTITLIKSKPHSLREILLG